MKKFLLLCLTITVSLLLFACGGEKQNEQKVKKTVITYCNWNIGTEEDNNLCRRRVEAFNKSHDKVRIEIITQPDGTSYDDFLATLASGGDLPDVFMVNSVPTAVINKWALEITDIALGDSEWNDIPQALRDSITYDGHIYAVPAGQYYMGLFANLDLIEGFLKKGESAEEVFAPGEFTTEKWIETVKAMRNITPRDGSGTIGMNAVGDMLNWLPSVVDKTGQTKHFVWDGKKFNFTSDILLDAFQIIADLGDPNNQYVYDAVPATEGEGDNITEFRSQIFGPGSASDVFTAGRMGFIQEGSWAGGYSNVDFNCMFTSYPDGKVVAATDFMVISKSCTHVEEAYEVAKYMTFGAEGANAMFDILDNNPDSNLTLTCIPLNTNEEISTRWFKYLDMKGLKEVFEAVEAGKCEVIVEGNKTIPGFLKARYTVNTGLSFPGVREGSLLTIGDFLWEVCLGNISINEYTANMTPQLEAKLNEQVTNDYASMGLTQ